MFLRKRPVRVIGVQASFEECRSNSNPPLVHFLWNALFVCSEGEAVNLILSYAVA